MILCFWLGTVHCVELASRALNCLVPALKTPNQPLLMIWIVVKIRLALPTTHSFIESLLCISTTRSYNLSKKCIHLLKTGIATLPLFQGKNDSMVPFLGMILLRNEPVSLSGVYVARGSFVGTLPISGALF